MIQYFLSVTSIPCSIEDVLIKFIKFYPQLFFQSDLASLSAKERRLSFKNAYARDQSIFGLEQTNDIQHCTDETGIGRNHSVDFSVTTGSTDSSGDIFTASPTMIDDAVPRLQQQYSFTSCRNLYTGQKDNGINESSGRKLQKAERFLHDRFTTKQADGNQQPKMAHQSLVEEVMENDWHCNAFMFPMISSDDCMKEKKGLISEDITSNKPLRKDQKTTISHINTNDAFPCVVHDDNIPDENKAILRLDDQVNLSDNSNGIPQQCGVSTLVLGCGSAPGNNPDVQLLSTETHDVNNLSDTGSDCTQKGRQVTKPGSPCFFHVSENSATPCCLRCQSALCHSAGNQPSSCSSCKSQADGCHQVANVRNQAAHCSRSCVEDPCVDAVNISSSQPVNRGLVEGQAISICVEDVDDVTIQCPLQPHVGVVMTYCVSSTHAQTADMSTPTFLCVHIFAHEFSNTYIMCSLLLTHN